MITREEVYKAIDTEREYQKQIEQDPERCRKDPNHTVGEFLTILRVYMSRADETWVSTAGDDTVLHFVRKIAGICVNCMEHHGAPKRGMAVTP